ncbi:MAG: type II toxin-antitoxin system RelE/ParE family toxin [Chthoniobacteraceae bacterium]
MKYTIEFRETAREDMKEIPRNFVDSITRKIFAMENGMPGSVKALRDMDYGFRLRLGHYRILFDVQDAKITIHRVLHRRHAYASKTGEKKRKSQH